MIETKNVRFSDKLSVQSRNCFPLLQSASMVVVELRRGGAASWCQVEVTFDFDEQLVAFKCLSTESGHVT